jgi:hypothetical protein
MRNGSLAAMPFGDSQEQRAKALEYWRRLMKPQ